MLKIKPFLLALSLSPLFLADFRPIQAQTSVGPAGYASGVTTVFPIPSPEDVGTASITDILSLANQTSLNSAATTVVTDLGSGSLAQRALLAVLQGPDLLDVNVAQSNLTILRGLTNTQLASPVALANGVTASVDANGVATVTIPSTTGGNPTVLVVNPPAGLTAPFRSRAALAAIAVLSAGGTLAQAKLAGSLAATGANLADVVNLVKALGGLFPPVAGAATGASLPTKNPSVSLNASSLLTAVGFNASSLKIKAMGLEKSFAIAQTRSAGIQVDPAKLNRVILAYNALIDNSTPEVVNALSKNEEFTLIGKSLRQLRASIR
jgi:hypothetical protein